MVKSKLYGFFGLFLAIFSFTYWFIPHKDLAVVAMFHMFFIVGNVLFFDFLSFYFARWSLLHSTKKLSLVSHFFLLGCIIGIVLEVYVHWFGRFWYYPLITNSFYYLAILPFYGIYAFYLLETFLGVKAVFERFFVRHKRKKKSFAGLKKLYLFIGAFSTIGIGFLSAYVLLQTKFGLTFQQTYSILYAPFFTNTSYYVFLALAILFWLFFEYLEYERHETSMTYELLKGNVLPLLAVVAAAWLSALAYEIFNVPGRGWVYENYPFSQIAIMNVPLMVYITWPFHYLPIFALYRVLFKKESVKLWE